LLDVLRRQRSNDFLSHANRPLGLRLGVGRHLGKADRRGGCLSGDKRGHLGRLEHRIVARKLVEALKVADDRRAVLRRHHRPLGGKVNALEEPNALALHHRLQSVALDALVKRLEALVPLENHLAQERLGGKDDRLEQLGLGGALLAAKLRGQVVDQVLDVLLEIVLNLGEGRRLVHGSLVLFASWKRERTHCIENQRRAHFGDWALKPSDPICIKETQTLMADGAPTGFSAQPAADTTIGQADVPEAKKDATTT
jgi:hypothetical protein